MKILDPSCLPIIPKKYVCPCIFFQTSSTYFFDKIKLLKRKKKKKKFKYSKLGIFKIFKKLKNYQNTMKSSPGPAIVGGKENQ